MQLALIYAPYVRLWQGAAINGIDDFCFNRQFLDEFCDLRPAIARARQVNDEGLDIHVEPERIK